MARIRILQKPQVLHFYRQNTAQGIGLQSVLVPRRSICSKNTSLFQQQNEWDQDREKINLKKFREGFSKNEPVSQINVNHIKRYVNKHYKGRECGHKRSRRGQGHQVVREHSCGCEEVREKVREQMLRRS